MLSFVSFPPPPEYDLGYEKHNGEDVDMSFEDEDDVVAGGLKLTYPGQSLTSSHTFMRGHGTYVDGDDILASVAGTIELVNKLVSVRPTRTRYNPEVGDLVVGRIAEVQPKRWKVDANSRQDAVLMLSSVNLPGGVQRRKLESDELEMRNFFEEGDLLVAEVQALFSDGAMSLHTRSLSYGKLRNGQLVAVLPNLVRRLKSHFLSLPCGVDLILGLNGYVWVSQHVDQTTKEGTEAFNSQTVYSNRNDNIDDSTRVAISRVTNIIRTLAAHALPLSDTILLEAYEWIMDNDTDVNGIILEDTGDNLIAALTARG